ncbi:protein of unknown function [Trichlorobacter ammonificans]|uniref:Uncharacterized protein n=1 Tax=Trichlorobacter ammonificans TaxID=2916410 RepID=A0ABM9DB35_9BACT|nr:protein of unknown function [Trichlorobacter ammonificans]
MKFFFRSKDDTLSRRQQREHNISLTGRDYDCLLVQR